ncbi:hypothetical protein ES332_D13G005500v1 [Gossypium tomentosum]|uniref:Uncharacterized protein n=1 Tax=Gossypium tomentosum TaxID=34277 RepID=A0A5D2HQV0_GOSTO|nr:hypothetical protein ES332_D13G005500v1 [Gossypium tomentosum]
MASFPKSLTNPIFVVVVVMVIFLCYTPLVLAQCEAESKNGCHDKEEAMKLKIIAFVAILLASMIGVSLPLFSRRMLSLGPERELFTIVKAFALGVILATGYMHVLPDPFDGLMFDCLPENPWRKFPFTTFVAILENGDVQIENHGHEHHGVMNEKSQQLLRHRVIAQAEYKFKLKAIMVLFFSATTALGIVLGIGLSKVYSETSPTSLIVVGLLNASSAGLLNYMALVDLLAADFLGSKLQTNMKLQIWS